MAKFLTFFIFRRALVGFIVLTMACGGDLCWTWSHVGNHCSSIDSSGYTYVNSVDSNDRLAACNSPDGDVHHADGGACTCSGHVPIVIPTPVMMWVGINGVVRILLPDSSTMPENIVSDIDLPPIIG